MHCIYTTHINNMATQLGHFPGHTTFQAQPVFTSTLDHKSGLESPQESSFNVWLIIITASFFFVMLSWYDFVSVGYSKIVKKKNATGNVNTNVEVLYVLGFALLWTTIAIVLLIILYYFGLIGSGNVPYWEEHPILEE